MVMHIGLNQRGCSTLGLLLGWVTVCSPVNHYRSVPVMLVLGRGLKAKFCGLSLGLAIGWLWPWPRSCGLGLGLRGVVLAKNSRLKYWQTTKFTMNFHRLE